MAGKPAGSVMPILSKIHFSLSEVVLVVRRRPNVANGGGFTVTDCNQKVVFRVDGCGIIGRKEEMILRDGDGNALLLIMRKGGIVEAVSLRKQWKGYEPDHHKLVFTLKEPKSCCFSRYNEIRISGGSYGFCEIRGDFAGRNCSIVNSRGDVIALIGVKEEVRSSKDLYQVVIKGGIDEAFVLGVVAVLDYIYDGSTRC